MGKFKSYQTTYHIIDSVKGGCGKTTFAVILTEFLGREERKAKEEKEKKAAEKKKAEKENEEEEKIVEQHVCLLDMDFLGTGLLPLVYGKEWEKEFGDENICITDRIRDFRTNQKQYVVPVKISGQQLNIAFGDPDYRARQAYRFRSKYNYTSMIRYEIFGNGIQDVLSKNQLESQMKGKVSHVVLDMSPSVDAYSESVKECLFEKKKSSFLKRKDKRNYFLMVGMDMSHVYTAIDYLVDFIKDDGKFPDKIFIVFNDVMQVVKSDTTDSTTEKECYNDRKKLFEDALKDISDKWKKGKIYFLAMNPYMAYREAVHENAPLKNTNKRVFGPEGSKKESEDFPFRFFAEFGGKFEEPLKQETRGEIMKWITEEKN